MLNILRPYPYEGFRRESQILSLLCLVSFFASTYLLKTSLVIFIFFPPGYSTLPTLSLVVQEEDDAHAVILWLHIVDRWTLIIGAERTRQKKTKIVENLLKTGEGVGKKEEENTVKMVSLAEPKTF